MERLKLSEIVRACHGSFGYPSDIDITDISTDTRTIGENSLFIALKGERFDGHDFARQAVERGAAAAVTERPVEGVRCIIVDSTMKALADIASFYRNRFGGLKLVGITGSAGKTSTKEMIWLVLSEKYNTLKTKGSLNNEIGLPHTLFGIAEDTQAAVIEMGMSHAGEISRLSLIARPELCVITNIGTAHIGNLGSQENILKAKLEILDGASLDAPLIVCLDDRYLAAAELRSGRRKLTYSVSKKEADVFASDIRRDENGSDFVINYSGGKIDARVNAAGDHNIKNALCAFYVGMYYGVEPENAVRAIASFKTDGIRQNCVVRDGIRLMLDCFNASPEAMKAALEVFRNASACGPQGVKGRKIAVLADMLELGKGSKAYHRSVGEFFALCGADLLVCYGEGAAQYAVGAEKKGFDRERCVCFTEREELVGFLKANLRQGDLVLLKGSHGMKLDGVYKEVFGSAADSSGNT